MTEAMIFLVKCHMVIAFAFIFLQIFLRAMNYRTSKRESEGND